MAKKSKKQLNEELKDSAQKIWLAGLGALATAEEEGTKLFNTLVERGEAWEARSKKQVSRMREKVESAIGEAESSWEKLGGALDEKVAAAIHRLGVPSRDEINRLTKRVEELTLKIDQMKGGGKKAN
jgi:poly(hydroxyalkanoate) granule-associated protein